MIGGLLLACCGGLYAQETGAPPAVPPFPDQELPEVLTRGPVHEAFAEPVTLQNDEPVTAPSPPPRDMEETPPPEKPRGENITWVPGYWAWDQDRSNFIWVSACWRASPPGLYWVPGYWVEQNSQWAWVSGFWAPTGVKDMQYLPAPPTLVDPDPGPPPEPNMLWVSPCWYWSSDQYISRPGYWLEAYPDWMWQPSHYVWTPRGYVFVRGHWDYAFDQRGVLFAPVAFSPGCLQLSYYRYSPSVMLDLGLLTASLFVYPRYGHYYFGDYYDDSYRRGGIYPWFECERYRSWYDPIYRHHRWRHRDSDPQWEYRQKANYDRRVRDRDERPARTYREMRERNDRKSEAQREGSRPAFPISEMTAGKPRPGRLEKISDDTRRVYAQQAGEVTRFKRERNTWESVRPDGTPPVQKTPEIVPREVRPREPRPAEPLATIPEVRTDTRTRDRVKTPADSTAPVAIPPPVAPSSPVRSRPSVESRPAVEPRPPEMRPAKTVEIRREPVRMPVEATQPEVRIRTPVVREPPPVRITRPERVTIPPHSVPVATPPAAGRPWRTAPPQPVGEQKFQDLNNDGIPDTGRRVRGG
ncbi:MAG: hypothetical protein R6X19_07485 [Kiritimatiellia bacterium]